MAKFWLQGPALAAPGAFPPRDILRALKIVKARRSEFLEAWHAHFSDP